MWLEHEFHTHSAFAALLRPLWAWRNQGSEPGREVSAAAAPIAQSITIEGRGEREAKRRGAVWRWTAFRASVGNKCPQQKMKKKLRLPTSLWSRVYKNATAARVFNLSSHLCLLTVYTSVFLRPSVQSLKLFDFNTACVANSTNARNMSS